MNSLVILLTLSLSTPIFCHDKNEDDYWKEEEFNLDESYKVFHPPAPDQMKYMIEPGGRCNPTKHHESVIRHYAIRHGLTVVTKREFTSVLNHMCTLVPTLAVLDLYQVMKCDHKRCICPFEWLTWSNVEKKCKVREGYRCGDVKILNATINLENAFGCEEGTECSEGTPAIAEFSSDSSTLLRPTVPICQCKAGRICERSRQTPPNTDARPNQRIPNKGNQSSIHIQIFFLILLSIYTSKIFN